MNRTNRAVNRIVLFIVGLISLVLGAAVIAVIVWPAGVGYWTGAAETGRTWLDDTIAATMIGATTISWLTIAALVVIILLVVILIVALTRIGGGRSHTVLRPTGAQNPVGRVTVKESFVSDALKHSLAQRDEILLSSVTANDIRKQPVMHVSVTPRQNTSPRRVVEDVDHLVANLAVLTGKNVPTYISIHSGLRATLAHDQRRLS